MADCTAGNQITSKGLATQRISRNEEVLYLLHRTIKELWIQFKDLERPFLVKSGRRAEEIRKGDYWAESDIEEKAGARKTGNGEFQLAFDWPGADSW